MMFLATLLAVYISNFLIFFYIYSKVIGLVTNATSSNTTRISLPGLSKEELMKIKMKLKDREYEDLDQLISKLRELRKKVEGVLNDF